MAGPDRLRHPECAFCNLERLTDVEFCGDFNFPPRPFSVWRLPPLNPVTPGHMIFIPDRHVTSAAADPTIAMGVFEHAAWYVAAKKIQANIITSVGEAASQTMMHVHVHVVPRRPGDGLRLPWTGQDKGTLGR